MEWVKGLGLNIKEVSYLGVAAVFVWLLIKNILYTKGQVDRLLDAQKEVSELWKTVAGERQQTINTILTNVEPLVQGNAALLQAVEKLQAHNEWERERADRQPPYRGGRRG